MTNDALHDRGVAMEDLFFRDVDQQLLDKLKAELVAVEDRTALMAATGIDEAAIIDQMIEQGISMRTFAGIGLIPLVIVAWADGKIEAKEREAVLMAVNEAGILKEQSSYALISSWLNRKPDEVLLGSWKAYIQALTSSLDEASVGQIKRSVMDRVKRVARSAGGFIGIQATSPSEKKVIEDLESTFE